MVFLSDILDHEKRFNQYIQYLSIGDTERAAQSAKALIEELRGTLKKIQADYPKLLIESQFPNYSADEKNLNSLATPLSEKELTDLAKRLESYVSGVSREIRRLRRKEPSPIVVFLSRYRKNTLIGLGTALGLFLLVWGVHYVVSMGHGLSGEYFGDTTLGIGYRRQVDPMIDFNWGRGGPLGHWRKNKFSVRWTGDLLVPKSGPYDLYIHVDDGARLYLDDKLIVDDWRNGKVRVLKASMNLQYGYHPIRIEYYEWSKSAVIRFFWKRPDSPRPEPVASQFLCPSENVRKRGIPVFGSQESSDDDGDDKDAGGNDDDADDTAAPAAVPPAKKG